MTSYEQARYDALYFEDAEHEPSPLGFTGYALSLYQLPNGKWRCDVLRVTTMELDPTRDDVISGREQPTREKAVASIVGRVRKMRREGGLKRLQTIH